MDREEKHTHTNTPQKALCPEMKQHNLFHSSNCCTTLGYDIIQPPQEDCERPWANVSSTAQQDVSWALQTVAQQRCNSPSVRGQIKHPRQLLSSDANYSKEVPFSSPPYSSRFELLKLTDLQFLALSWLFIISFHLPFPIDFWPSIRA